MTDQPINATAVRLLSAAGNIVGVGVLVGPREILTCAHVVNAALGRGGRAQQRPAPEDEVTVKFTVGDASPLRARVQCWLPPPRAGAIGDDIAGLCLTSSELPTAIAGITPARLAANPPAQGQVVYVFGYPDTPPRPDGAWVEATVRGQIGTRGRHLQLDSTADSALRIQAGFSGSPVYHHGTGKVVGLLTTAARATSPGRDSYAITAKQLQLAWPEVLDPRHTPSSQRPSDRAGALTVLHISDIHFGQNHLFGSSRHGLASADQAYDTLFKRLHEDLEHMAAQSELLRPDLMVVTGDLAAQGKPSEFEQAVTFLFALSEAVQLPREHVALVPGNHDVNQGACIAYFQDQQAAEEEPRKPYWPKWKHFAAAFERFYEGVSGVSFTPDEPWSLFEMPDLAVVVAGLNSTMAESHRDTDHYGEVGERQLGWFADRLARYHEQGWLRLAAVHHNAVRGALAENENLRDADELDRILGSQQLVNLLLHGHTHDKQLHRLPSGLLAVSTGSAAVTADARPQENPNQYQLLTIRPDGLTRYARQYALGQRRWIGDTRISPDGSNWHHHEPYRLWNVHTTFPPSDHTPDEPPPDRPREQPRSAEGVPSPTHEFFDRVVEATKVSHPDAKVTPRQEYGYLRVSLPLPGGGCKQWAVGVVDGAITEDQLRSFVQTVHLRFTPSDPTVRSELVYSGPVAAEDMVVQARRQGVWLRSFIDYQGLIDLRPLVERQTARLADDRIYLPELYIPQRYRLSGNARDAPARDAPAQDDVLGQVIEWLGTDGARLVMVLGDSGRGKTFLLRELARALPDHLPHLWPVLVELRTLEKEPSVEALLAQHLFQQKVDTVDIKKLDYMIRSGRLALLFDGFDELELRVGYDNATDYLKVLLRAVTGQAKVVLTSRSQHFESINQLHTALGDQVNRSGISQVVVLEDFTDAQIKQFLAKHYGGDQQRAQHRFALLRGVRDLQELSRNPQMLSFIANHKEERLRAIRDRRSQISAAELYRELVQDWLSREANRDQSPSRLDKEERFRACTLLALRLWKTTTDVAAIPAAELATAVSEILGQLAELNYTAEEGAHTIGLGTLLIRTPEDKFGFVHQSVMEWLVAEHAAERLRRHQVPEPLLTRKFSTLMVDFFCDLAGHKAAKLWAAATLANPAASEGAKDNAQAINKRLGVPTEKDLTGHDLHSRDLTACDLRDARMRGANLRDMRLVATNFSGADLREADFSGARLIEGDLTGAKITGSRWHRAALLGVAGVARLAHSRELAEAATTDWDRAEVMISPNGIGSSVTFSPCGELLAVARGSGVEIVDVASGHPLRVISGHAQEVTAVAFSPDGTLLATASWDGTTRLTEVATGQHQATLTGHTEPVTAVAFSPDRDHPLLATASWDCSIQLWNCGTRQHLRTLQHAERVTAVAFSPDSLRIATASWDGVVQLWNLPSCRHRIAVQGSAKAIEVEGSVMFRPSPKDIVRGWDMSSGQHRTTLANSVDAVTSVAFSPDGTLLATTSYDGTIRLFDIPTGQPRATLKDYSDPVTAVAFSPDGTLLATTSHDGTTRLINTTTGQRHTTLTGHTNPVTAVAFSPDGTLLATTSHDGTARLCEVATGQRHTTLTGHIGPVTAVAFSPDGTLLATASWDCNTHFWDPTTGRHCATFQGHHTGPVTAVAFSPDGTLLATTSHDGTARLSEVATGQHRSTFGGHTDWVTSVAFSPDGTLLAATYWDHTTRLWETTSKRSIFRPAPRHILKGHTALVTSVAFSPDGTLLATASADGTTRLWEPATGQQFGALEGHTNAVRGVAFSPDGALLATASSDGTTRLWNTATGTFRAALLALEDGGYAVLLPDGSYKLEGDPGRSLWWAIKLCRFAAGELDSYKPAIQRLEPDAPIRPSNGGSAAPRRWV